MSGLDHDASTRVQQITVTNENMHSFISHPYTISFCMIHCAITLNGQQLTVRAHCDIDDLLLDPRHHSRVNCTLRNCSKSFAKNIVKFPQGLRNLSPDFDISTSLSKIDPSILFQSIDSPLTRQIAKIYKFPLVE